MKQILIAAVCLFTLQNSFAQQFAGTHNFLRFDTLKVYLDSIPWEVQDGYQYRQRIKNYWNDTIFCPESIVIYHDSRIEPRWYRPVPLPPRKSRDIIITIYPHRPEWGGRLEKSGSIYVFTNGRKRPPIWEEYPVIFRCTVAPRLPDTTMQGNQSLIKPDAR